MTTAAAEQTVLPEPQRPPAWQELDALGRSVIAAFSGQVDTEDGLTSREFVAGMEEAFPGIVGNAIAGRNQLPSTVIEAMRLPILNRLHVMQRDALPSLTDRLKCLAGNSAGAIALADQAEYAITHMVPPTGAVPGLQFLSEVIIERAGAPGA